MSKFVVIRIPFNNRAYNEKRLTAEWISSRLDLFNKYTLKCFKMQTNQNFEVLLECDRRSLDTVNEIVSRKLELPSNIHFGTLIQKSDYLMNIIKLHDVIYEVRIDSDNMYCPDYIQKLYEYNPKVETEAIICQNGYIYNCNTNKLARFFAISPSFYALVYQAQDYIQGKNYSLYGGHSAVKNLKYEVLAGEDYMILIHGSNVLNTDKIISSSKLIEGKEKKVVLDRFGI